MIRSGVRFHPGVYDGRFGDTGGDGGGDLGARLPHQRVTQQRNLALLVAVVLYECDVNLMVLGAALPMEISNRASRFQKLKGILANPHIRPGEVMAPYAHACGDAEHQGPTVGLGDPSEPGHMPISP